MRIGRHIRAGLILCLTMAAAACAGDVESSPTTTTTTIRPAVAVTAADVADATITLDGVELAMVAGETATPHPARVRGTIIGDVTGDGVDDALVAILDMPEVFHYTWFVVLTDRGEGIEQTNAVSLGDVVQLHDVRLDEGLVEVRWSVGPIPGSQTRTEFGFDPSTDSLVEIGSESDIMISGDDNGLLLGAGQHLIFGMTRAEASEMLVPILGEPAMVNESPTCWGLTSSLFWEASNAFINLHFLEDEFFSWSSADPRIVASGVSPGASTAWLEQVFDTEFTTRWSEIGGGTFVNELPGTVAVDEAVTEVQTVRGEWSLSDYGRPDAQVLDPLEHDVWCGD